MLDFFPTSNNNFSINKKYFFHRKFGDTMVILKTRYEIDLNILIVYFKNNLLVAFIETIFLLKFILLFNMKLLAQIKPSYELKKNNIKKKTQKSPNFYIFDHFYFLKY